MFRRPLRPRASAAVTGIAELASGVRAGDRRSLARAITLIESAREDHRADAARLLEAVGHGREALRIGLSGTPGVGKSTFIEAFGMMLTGQGKRVAVLAVDPSSARSGGSILGDKTRMPDLSRDPRAFIRPSPAQAELGGVARRTREAVALCEAAGFDIVVIETVGVGQSETLVAGMSDVFVLLMAPAGGDELQGVKRGIMETADLILVNKADGELKPAAERTRADYAGALRLLRRREGDPEGIPAALTVSALTGEQLDEAWRRIESLADWRRETGCWGRRRAAQRLDWFREEVRRLVLARVAAGSSAGAEMERLSAAVTRGEVAPAAAAASFAEAVVPKRP